MCCDPNRATQCRAHNVAADSRSFRDVIEMPRNTPTKHRVAPAFPPPWRSCVRCVLERGEVSHWKCQRCRRNISFRKRIALHGGVAATLTPIALHGRFHLSQDRNDRRILLTDSSHAPVNSQPLPCLKFPALQKTFVSFLCGFAQGFGIEYSALEKSVKRHQRRKENLNHFSAQRSGRMLQKFGGTFALQLVWL